MVENDSLPLPKVGGGGGENPKKRLQAKRIPRGEKMIASPPLKWGGGGEFLVIGC